MPPLHPLGGHQDPTKDRHNQENRRAVASCLELMLADPDFLSDRVNSSRDRADALVGLPLSPRFVSRLELSRAWSYLCVERADLAVILTLKLNDHVTDEKAAERLHCHIDTFKSRKKEALDWLIDFIWP